METAALIIKNCRHCDTSFTARANAEFCCSGCEFVFGLIQGHGLQNYYSIRDANPPACPVPVQTSSETYDYCDDPEFIKRISADGLRIEFFLEGLNCTACLWLLEKLPEFCSDAVLARVNFANSTIEVTRCDGGSFASIARTLNRFGYRPHPVDRKETTEKLRKKENRRDLIRIGLAGFCTGNIMILAVSLYGGADGVLADQFRWLTALLAAPVLSFCAWPFYRSTWGALRNFQLNIDVPIVAALLSGVIASVWGLIQGIDTVYFDSLSMLVLLLLSSRFWLKRIQQEHLDVAHLEDFLLLSSVQRIGADGRFESVSSLSLRQGDVIQINEGVVPTDGMVVQGEGLLETSVLTGESAPFQIKKGDRVEAGSRSLSGPWLLAVEKSVTDSRLAEILKDTERSAQNKPTLVLLADRVSQWFIATVFAIAALLVLYFSFSSPHEGFTRALALVIVTCPCVFGMAVPLSMSLAIRAAAKKGIVIKNADVIERLARIRTLFFDKTGTLTRGDLRVLEMRIEDPNDLRLNDHLAAAYAIEENQSHPIAHAIREKLKEFDLKTLTAEHIQLLKEGGIQGEVNGAHYSICPLGSPKVDNQEGQSQIKALYGLYHRDHLQKNHQKNHQKNQLIATFEVGDQVRTEASELLDWTKSRGLQISILSGDKASVVERCGSQLGLQTSQMISEASPERKSEILKSHGATAMMIGDGANDAAALASASVGVAVRGSMDISLRAADIYLTRSNLLVIPEIFALSRRTRGAIARNLIFSASFNIVAGTLAVLGYMAPLWAAVLMPLSSLTVLVSALLTGRRLMDHD